MKLDLGEGVYLWGELRRSLDDSDINIKGSVEDGLVPLLKANIWDSLWGTIWISFGDTLGLSLRGRSKK